MKKILILITCCFISTWSNAAFQFGASSSSSGAKVAQQMQRLAEAKAALEARQHEYAHAGYFEKALMQAVDELGAKLREILNHTNELATDQRDALDAIVTARIEQIRNVFGEETRTTIHSTAGDIFKASFCGITATLGAILVYKNLCKNTKEEDESTKKEKYIKASIGGACIVAAGILGHYWFR